jgi:hypothetical protein
MAKKSLLFSVKCYKTVVLTITKTNKIIELVP